MKRATSITAVVASLLAVFAVTDMASGQVVAYRHRSTVFGDHAAGAAELVRAQGAFLRDHAAAAEQWVNVAAARDQLFYQRVEHAWQIKQMRLDYINQKAANNRERQQFDAAAEMEAAKQLLQSAQQGLPMWPALLKQPQFAGSIGLIESLLKGWAPNDPSAPTYRQALATEAGVLRNRIANDTSLNYHSRVEAVETLQRLQLLAGMPAEQLAAASQIAMR